MASVQSFPFFLEWLHVKGAQRFTFFEMVACQRCLEFSFLWIAVTEFFLWISGYKGAQSFSFFGVHVKGA